LLVEKGKIDSNSEYMECSFISKIMKFSRSHEEIFTEMMGILRARLGARIDAYLFPPPIFVEMEGEFLDMNLEKGTFTAKFPILDKYLNPYRAMQGGMIATAVDNTIGPLSVMIAPVNVTRNLEMKYSKPVTLEMEYFVVVAKLKERKDPKIFFEAVVLSLEGIRLAKGKAVHWIVGQDLA
jgi:acyl-coenzyme A thioesterase PaaI-like protein